MSLLRPVLSSLRSGVPLLARGVHVSSVASSSSLTDSTFFRRKAFEWSGFNQYGLYHDDLLAETDEVMEALRRLPLTLQDERNYRVQRAAQLSVQKTILPKEQWVSYEEHEEKGFYLTSYLKQIEQERLRREEWELKQ